MHSQKLLLSFSVNRQASQMEKLSVGSVPGARIAVSPARWDNFPLDLLQVLDNERRKHHAGHTPEHAMKGHTISFYVILGAVLLAFIRSFALLFPILLSFFLILMISVAVNPFISRLKALIGGRIFTVVIVTGAFVGIIGLT
jgi:hypothetical protein